MGTMLKLGISLLFWAAIVFGLIKGYDALKHQFFPGGSPSVQQAKTIEQKPATTTHALALTEQTAANEARPAITNAVGPGTAPEITASTRETLPTVPTASTEWAEASVRQVLYNSGLYSELRSNCSAPPGTIWVNFGGHSTLYIGDYPTTSSFRLDSTGKILAAFNVAPDTVSIFYKVAPTPLMTSPISLKGLWPSANEIWEVTFLRRRADEYQLKTVRRRDSLAALVTDGKLPDGSAAPTLYAHCPQ